MKKLLAILMVMVLGACAPSTEPYDDTSINSQLDTINATLAQLEAYDDSTLITELDLLQAQLDLLDNYDDAEVRERLTALETRLNNISVLTGLNGSVSYYENDNELLTITNQIGRMSVIIEQMKDTIDKTKLPDYMFDVDGEYISFEQLGELLKLKYFPEALPVGEILGDDTYMFIPNAYMQFTMTSDLTEEDIIARTILLIEEARHYDFYTLSANSLAVSVYSVDDPMTNVVGFRITIPNVIVRNDAFTINVDGILSQDYEMTIDITTDNALVQQYYDDYVLAETYAGYVLDYKE